MKNLVKKILISLYFLGSLIYSCETLSFNNLQVINANALANFSGQIFNNIALTSPLHQEIQDYFDQNADRIAQRQIDSIERGRNLSVFGGLNHVGFNFNRSFATFNLELRRDVAPDLFDIERWIVTDMMTISIDASQVLSKMRDAGAINITDGQLGLFSGIVFKRNYRYTHFSSSYEEGLTINLNKLFSSFLNFRSKSFLQLEEYELIEKEDFLGFQAGGVGSAPIGNALAVSLGALVEYERMAKVSIQSLGEEDLRSSDNDFLRISYEKSEVKRGELELSLMADFLGIIQASILSFDFNYSAKENYRVHLGLSYDEKEELLQDTELANEIGKILKHQDPRLDVIAPYIVSEERRQSEIKGSRYSFLLIGGAKDQETEQVQVAKDGRVRTFFRHNFEKVKYHQDLASRLTQIFFKSFLRLETIVQESFMESESISLVYNSEKNLLQDQADLILDGKEERLSLNFSKRFYSHKTTGKIGSVYKNKAIELLTHYSGADPVVANLLENDAIKGPLRINVRYNLNEEGLNYFHSRTGKEIYSEIARVCRDYSKKKEENEERSASSSCLRKIEKAYEKYLKELVQEDYTGKDVDKCIKKTSELKKENGWSHLLTNKHVSSCIDALTKKSLTNIANEIPLWRLREFLQELHEQSRSKADLYNIFGLRNVFSFGSISAVRSDGSDFVSYFNEGRFSGMGIVENHIQSTQTRLPASVE